MESKGKKVIDTLQLKDHNASNLKCSNHVMDQSSSKGSNSRLNLQSMSKRNDTLRLKDHPFSSRYNSNSISKNIDTLRLKDPPSSSRYNSISKTNSTGINNYYINILFDIIYILKGILYIYLLNY